ncbi:MAG: CRISPR-associated endonuclease Cas2 [Sphingobacteriales bacterium]|nr:CRISPR-associated endonuclease Cas2 [Sphingobacteriales bacterium]MCC7222506.1 CRISPR-associated endonuclease Cas2 [Chitinophagales bacterium]
MNTYCIAYDIAATPLRSKLAKKLRQLGCTRIQKSLFIIYRCSDKELSKIKTAIITLLKDKTTERDSVLCLLIDAPPSFWVGSHSAPSYDVAALQDFF